jgi:hypothetical protein
MLNISPNTLRLPPFMWLGLTWLQYLLHLYPNQHPTTTPPPPLPIPLDNKAILDDLAYQPNDTTSPFRYLHPNYDIIQAIQQLVPTLPIKVKLYHVKSHQDKSTTNAHATAIHHMPPNTTGLFPSWIPITKVALYHQDQQVTSNIPAYIRTTAHPPT